MNAVILYLFESALCIWALYAIYWFFLRRDTFFGLNRFYLLAMAIVALVLPLVPPVWTPSGTSSTLVVMLQPVLITPGKVEQTMLEHLQWIEIAAVVYFTGVAIFFLRFIMQLFQVWRIARRFGINRLQGDKVVWVDRGYVPFSFFNLVFINESAIPEGSLSTILAHERVHIRQHHSMDMVVFELAAIVQWFNPLIWLAGRELKSIHEYLADEGVLQNGISRPKYQQMILDETMGIRVNDLTNNFNVSLLKKRIAMMTKPKSGTWAKSKLLIALPALLVLLFIITARSYSNSGAAVSAGAAVFKPVEMISDPAPVMQDKTKQEKPETEVFTTVEKMPAYPGGPDAMIKFLTENVKYPEAAVKNGVQGKVFVTFLVRSDGYITNVKILRGIGSGCDEEALRVIKLMPKWQPGEQKGKPVDVQFNLPIKFALDNHKKEEPKK